MDVARLPIAGYGSPGYPVSSGGRAGERERVVELVTEVDAAQRAGERVEQATGEKVVQGEVLERERAHYSSTHDYLNGRMFDGETGTDDRMSRNRADAGQANRALGAYLAHTREYIQPDANRGRQVDYFI